MQPIKVKKYSDIGFYDFDLDMWNFRNKNIDVYDDVLRFFQNHEGMFNLEVTQDLIVASNYKNRVNKKVDVIRKILETQTTREVE